MVLNFCCILESCSFGTEPSNSVIIPLISLTSNFKDLKVSNSCNCCLIFESILGTITNKINIAPKAPDNKSKKETLNILSSLRFDIHF